MFSRQVLTDTASSMSRIASAIWVVLLVLFPLGSSHAERILEQLTIARESETSAFGVSRFLVPAQSDSAILEIGSPDLIPIADRQGNLTNLYRVAPLGAVTPIGMASRTEARVTLLGTDPSGRFLAVGSGCSLDRAGSQACKNGLPPDPAMYLVDTQSGDASLITHLPDLPDVIAPLPYLGPPGNARISTDGRYVFYVAGSDALVSGVANPSNVPLTYRFDRQTGVNQRVGRFDGIHADAYRSTILWASDDGLRALIAQDSGLVRFNAAAGGDTPVLAEFGSWEFVNASRNGDYVARCDAFLSETPPGAATAFNQFTRISVADGSRVVVNPAPQNMVRTDSCTAHVSNDGDVIIGIEWHPGPALGTEQVVRWTVADRQRKLLTPKAGTLDAPSNGFSRVDDVSADGSRVLIQTTATDLVPGGNGPESGGLYLSRNDSAELTLLFPSSTDDLDALHASGRMTTSGQWIHIEGFGAPATVRDDNEAGDLFTYRVADGALTLATRRRSELARAPNHYSGNAHISEDGALVAFDSHAGNLIDGVAIPTGSHQVYLSRTEDRTTTLISKKPGMPTQGAQGDSFIVGISADGRNVAFSSTTTDLHNRAVSGPSHAKGVDSPKETFVWNRDTGVHTLITRSTTSPLLGANSGASIAFDRSGTHVLHDAESPQRFLAEFVGQPSGQFHNALLRLPVDSGSTAELVTHAHNQPNTGPNAPVRHLGHSGDLDQVAFSTQASNLLATPVTSTLDQIYVADRTRGRTHLVTRSAAVPGSGSGVRAERFDVPFSRDGRYVAFTHAGSDLVLPLESGPPTFDCYLMSLETNVLVRVSERVVGSGREAICHSVSDDGRYVLYTEFASSTGGPPAQVWRADMTQGTRDLVSPPRNGPDDFAASFAAGLSADGDQALFLTQIATPFPTPPGTFAENLFLRNMTSGTLELITNGDAPGIDLASTYLTSLAATPDFGAIVFADESTTLKPRIVGAPGLGDIFVSRATRLSDNPGITGLWGEPGVEGQGFHLIGIPGDKRVLLSWYTYLPEGAVATRTKQRWLLGLGDIEDGIARFEVSAADSGLFDMAGAGVQVPLGEVIFRFGDCNRAEVEYAVDLNGRRFAGLIPLTRITPDTACSGFAATGDAAVTNLPRPANSRWQYGMNGAWHDPAKPGQGLLVEVMPNTQQVITTWFAFDPGQTLGDDRQPPLWLAAIGPISGDRAPLSVFETAGGTLDRSGGATLTPVGTLNLDAVSCTRAMATYSVTLGGVTRAGQIPLERITPSSHCSP